MSTIIKAGFWKNATKVLKGELDLEALIKRIAGNNSGGGGALPVLTEYPTTDASKAGQTFWYKGRIWEYLTQAKIDALGWNAEVGFPAPLDKVRDNILLLGIVSGGIDSDNVKYLFQGLELQNPITFDFLGLGNPSTFKLLPPLNQFIVNPVIGGIRVIRNAGLLNNLADIGTQVALTLGSSFTSSNTAESAVTLNQLFTDLPATTKTATINVANNPGAATCDPSIATAKGYTVVT